MRDQESIRLRNALGFIDSTNPLYVSTDGESVSNFETNDIEEASSSLTYIGLENREGTWQLKKIDTSSGNSFQYATEENNSSYTTYDTAWAARASLNYANYSEVI